MTQRFKKIESILLPSIIELLIIFFMSFHLRYPMESGYLLWQHIELGKADITERHITTHNFFSYLPTRPIKRSSWLSDDMFYLLYTIGKYKAIIIVKLLILVFLFTAPFYMFGENASMYTLILPIYIILTLPGTALRPGLFALLMFLLFIYGLYKNNTVLMGILVFLWSFVHGTYILGTFIFLLYIAFNLRSGIKSGILKIWPLILAILPLFLPHSSLTIFTHLHKQSFLLKGFEEWLPVKFVSFHGFVFLLYIFLWIYAVVKKRDLRWAIYGGILLILGLRFRRFIPFVVISGIPIIMFLKIHFMDRIEYMIKETMRYPLYIMLFCVYFILRTPGFSTYFKKQRHPYGCESMLKSLNDGKNILTLQAWVPYLYFSTHGRHHFAIDATLTQEDTYIKTYFDFLAFKGDCESELRTLKPDYVLLPRSYYKKIGIFCERCLKIEHQTPHCVIWRNKCTYR